MESIPEEENRSSFTENFKDICKYEAFELAELLVHSLVLCTIIFSFLAFGVKVTGPSMLPTLHSEDYLFCHRFSRNPTRGDVIIISNPNQIHEKLVKRVIATGGDRVDIDFNDGTVYVNGTPLDEPYTNTPTNLRPDWELPRTIPHGKYFVLGDNRNNSMDSRTEQIGLIDGEAILGKAVLIILPFSRVCVL